MDIMSQIIAQASIDGFALKAIAIVFIIIFNLVMSVLEAIKLKSFSFKKLPQFANDLVMSLAGIAVAELLVCLTIGSTWVNPVMIGLREVILIAILGCFVVKSLQSMKIVGWSVNVDGPVQFMNNKEEEMAQQFTSLPEIEPIAPAITPIPNTVPTADQIPAIDPTPSPTPSMDQESNDATSPMPTPLNY